MLLGTAPPIECGTFLYLFFYMIFRLPLCMRGSLKTFIAWLG